MVLKGLMLDVNVSAVLVSLNLKTTTTLHCINKCDGNFIINLPLLLHNFNVTCTHLKSSK